MYMRNISNFTKFEKLPFFFFFAKKKLQSNIFNLSFMGKII